jgi:Uncharacterized conserved protein
MLSGEGAYLHGGRWNSKGVRVVYLGTSLAQAAMELLIHLGRSKILEKYCKMSVSFDESLLQHIDIDDLPENWAEASMTPQVQDVGDQWVVDASSPFLQVPSAAIKGEYNYLYNPAHPDAASITLGAIQGFTYDPRLGA